MAAETNYDTLFGIMAVDSGLCTKQELQKSQKKQKVESQSNPILLSDLMVAIGYVTKSQAQRLLTDIRTSKSTAQKIPGYKILGKLGAGAMAVVYKANQISLNRKVAIKLLPKRFSKNPEYVKRFYKEGQAAGKLHHNNIVQAIDVGEAGGYHYFVMEYVDGKTISEDLVDGGVYEEEKALDIVIQVARALEHATARELVHRDVKPKNIMIMADGTVKLADMGLARETTDLETAQDEEGKAYGTPYYIAPEQIRGAIDLDGRADIYGLGATFYHMVTGRVPFMADDSAEIMKKHLREKLVPPDHINTSLTTGTSEVIEIMMAKRREDRYANATELLEDLEAIRNGRPPVQARKRFDVSMLEKLEEGDSVQDETDDYDEETIAKYRVAVIALGAFSGVLSLVILLMMLL
ncbi:MAG: serine/threonine protein kinase [Planctomycetes bacterium]|nr:serine/threonine protein kinase [Planctomycetota bacterium]